jgi:DNA-binding response OmpR family regulator
VVNQAEQRAVPAHTVLVVDDDRRVRELIRLTLEEGGFEVATAADGAEAIAFAGSVRPGLLLLDLTLPRADGFAVAAAVRRIHGDGVPILVVTADGSPAEKAGQLGARGWLRKPFDVDELVALVDRALGEGEPPSG